MTVRGTLAYLRFDTKIILRERLTLLLILALPAVMYAFFALLFGNQRYSGNSFYTEYTASFSGLILLNIALMNIGPVLTIYRELGFFRRLMATPLSMNAIWLSAIVRSAVLFLLGQFEMVLLGYWIFGRVPGAPVVQLLLGALICMFSLFSMGFLLGSVFKNANSAFNAGILIFQPMLLLSGASFPLSMFPSWVRFVTQFIPMTHVVETLRLAWRGALFTADAVWPVAYLLIFGCICAFIAQMSFRKASI